MEQKNEYGLLSANALKLLALFSMTLDHIGLSLFPAEPLWRIAGRLAFPIFAYMIAEGCRFTRDRARYFWLIFLEGVLCQAAEYLADGSLHLNILLTFSVSVLCCYALRAAARRGGAAGFLLAAAALGGAYLLCAWLPARLAGSPFAFRFDYGFAGAVLPAAISLPHTRAGRLVAAAIGLAAVCLAYGGLQWWSMLALVPLALYNGRRGKLRLKYLFYIYFPLHHALIWCARQLLGRG